MLSGPEIERLVNAKQITIEPFTPAKIQPNSYDLTLGGTMARCVPNRPGYDLIDLADQGRVVFDVPIIGGAFHLDPHKVYLAHTNEVVGSDYYAPMLHGRSSVARHGVAVHITAGFGDVGWYGQFVLEVINHNPYPVLLPIGARICQISWEPVTGELLPYASTYQDQRGIRPSKGIV